MSFRNSIEAKIGLEAYARMAGAAEQEVKLAMQEPLKDKFEQDLYYSPRTLLKEFQRDYGRFEKAQLRILAADLVSVLFRCKLLRAVKTEKEFSQRSGAVGLFENRSIRPAWSDKGIPLDELESRCVGALEADIAERTLVVKVSSLNPDRKGQGQQQVFFEDLFRALSVPLVGFVASDLAEEHKKREPGLQKYESKDAVEFFSAPSFGYTVVGTSDYCFWHGTVWLRTFLNMLRIGSFVHPGQVDFFLDAKMEPPTYPVFLGRRSRGAFQWQEDKKEPWQKFPDGSLFRSWGFRGLSNMWLDERNFKTVKQFLLDHKCVFNQLSEPWSDASTEEVAPVLDILSSATQIPDLGAKILLIYCCLEHLFVPPDAGAENSKYIIGGLNALKPTLVTWFRDLYALRNEYAHKGFVIRTDRTLALIRDSVQSVMLLLAAKLSVP